MIAVPCPTPCAKPALFIVANDRLEDDQVAEVVKSCVEPSVKVPVAVNCWFAPAGTDGLSGDTMIEAKTAGVTDNVAVPLIAPEVAEIVVVPTFTPRANPEVLMLATLELEEFHVTELVRF